MLVALLQNSQQRADQSTQHKLNAIALGLADLMDAVLADTAAQTAVAHVDAERLLVDRLSVARRELHEAVGLEEHESA